jgi:hypothetical protein
MKASVKNTYPSSCSVFMISSQQKLSWLAVSLWMGTIGLTGCQGVSGGAIGTTEGEAAPVNKTALACKLPEAQATESKPKISLLIDGSASMLGYAKTPNSRYLQILKLLDSLSLSNAGGVDYARLDDGGKSIARAEFQQAQTPAFYTGKTNKTSDALNEPAAKAKTEKLLAIITDLQQDDGDIKLTSKKILDNYLRQEGYAVAVWGFKSEFDDYIYPLNNSAKFPYKSKDIASGRPFYLFLVGKKEAITTFAKEFRAQGDSLVSDAHNHLTIFSPQQVANEVAYLNAPLELPRGIKTPVSLVQEGFAIEDGGQPIRLLETSDTADKAKIQYTLPWKTNPDFAQPRELLSFNNFIKYNSDKKSFEPEKNVNGGFAITSQMGDQKISVEVAIDPPTLQAGLYYLKTDLQATAVQVPNYWNDWDDPTDKNGAKTAGLKDFLGSLALNTSAILKEKPLIVARLCHGLQKN